MIFGIIVAMKKLENLKNNKKIINTSVILIINSMISILFYRSHYWIETTEFRIKLRTYAVLFLLLVLIPIVSYLLKGMNDWIGKTIEKVKSNASTIVNYITHNQTFVLKTILLYGIVIVVSCLVAYVLIQTVLNDWETLFKNNSIVYGAITAIGGVLTTCYLLWKTNNAQVHKIFCCIALITGTFFCWGTPCETGISWDDEVHYMNVANMVNIFNGYGFKADEMMIEDYISVAVSHYGYDTQTRVERENLLNESYENRELGISYNGSLKVGHVGYIPHAIGLIVGRGLSLSYTSCFRLGRYFSLLTYIVLITIAIKKIKHAKVLMAFIGLFPTELYMACSYSYDPWIVAFSLLGCSYFFNMFETEGIETSDIVKMLICFTVGFVVKAVYFPALFVLLFLPSKNFKSKKQHRLYLLGVILTALFLVAAIAMPLVMSGSGFGTGDTRGGSEVNSTEQVKYFLSEPLSFMGVLFNYIFGTLLNPLYADKYIQNYGYMSYITDIPIMQVTTVLFYLIAFLDNDGKKKKSLLMSITGIFGIFWAVFLVAAALYVSYTAVRYHTVSGCQPRYLTPLVFMTIYLLQFDKLKNPINKDVFKFLPLIFLSMTFILWTGVNLYGYL